MIWVLIIAMPLVGFLIWWLLIESEGVYLGRRVVVWLYDIYANRYDAVKEFDEVSDHLLLAQPIMLRMHPHTDPMILDVATGTGRFLLAMCSHARFEGFVVGVDLSRKMLGKAAGKIQQEHFEDYVALLWDNAEHLPFSDETFDAVTCLEALEFMPSSDGALAELCRVLRPGGTLLITMRIGTRWMPNKLWSEFEVMQLLHSYGMDTIEIEHWQTDYKKVWATKSGASKFVGASPLGDILRCPRCPDYFMVEQSSKWICEGCSGEANIAEDGVIELYTL